MRKKWDAILWDNQTRLEGQIIFYPDRLQFTYKQPGKSVLHLEIPKDQIRSIEEYLLFGIERKGIRIRSGENQTDQFIVDDPRAVRRSLEAWLND